MRLTAAKFAVQFERPALAAVAGLNTPGLTLERLVAQAFLPPVIEGRLEEVPVAKPDDRS